MYYKIARHRTREAAKSSDESIVEERGISKAFETLQEADDYAKHSSGRKHGHRFLRRNTSYYVCASKGCRAYRRIVEKRSRYYVKGMCNHNHLTIATSQRHRVQKATEDRLEALSGCATPLQRQAIVKGITMSTRQLSNIEYYRCHKRMGSMDIDDWTITRLAYNWHITRPLIQTVLLF